MTDLFVSFAFREWQTRRFFMNKYFEEFAFTLKERGFSQSTIATYSSNLRNFFVHAAKDPQLVTPEEIRHYQVFLIDKKFKPRTVNCNLAAVKFFYLKTLKKEWPEKFLPWVKVRKSIPNVLSREEVATVINAALNIKHQVMLMAIYGGGLRSCEVVRLKPLDIDSKRNVIKVLGKGDKERQVPLGEELLLSLRAYWRANKTENKSLWLFPNGLDNLQPYSISSVKRFFQAAKVRAGISKPGGPHLFRHSFATHLLEAGLDIRIVQILLGHSELKSTTIYTHVQQQFIAQIKNPLEAIADKIIKR
jgi:integrase/recombinase XerD